MHLNKKPLDLDRSVMMNIVTYINIYDIFYGKLNFSEKVLTNAKIQRERVKIMFFIVS